MWGQHAQQPLGSAFLPTEGSQVFYGVVKSFNEEKGWGHIACDATRQMFGKDMFVMRSAVRGARLAVGDEVQFTVQQGRGGPEAAAVSILSHSGSVNQNEHEGYGRHEKQESAGQYFLGSLKMFDAEKGWGFIECDETRQLYGKDIFAHKREFMGSRSPDNGDRVRFVVEAGRDGRPEARSVVLQEGDAGVNAGGAYGFAAPAAGGAGARSAPY